MEDVTQSETADAADPSQAVAVEGDRHRQRSAWYFAQLRPQGRDVVGKVRFEARIRELVENLPDLAALVEPLLVVRRTLREQFCVLHRRLLAIVRDDEVCRRLMTTPGVGPVVSLTYRATVDVQQYGGDPRRPPWTDYVLLDVDGGAIVQRHHGAEHRASSSSAGTPHRPARWRASGGAGRRTARERPSDNEQRFDQTPSGEFSTSSLMRALNLTLPTTPTLKPKLRRVPRRSLYGVLMAIAFDCSSLRWVSSMRSF